jgi:anti-sigma factor RsiW
MAVPSRLESPDSACAVFRTAFDAVVDGETGSLCAARLEAHVAACAPCARRLAAARSRKRRLRAIGEAERAPTALHDAVMASLRGVRGSRTS